MDWTKLKAGLSKNVGLDDEGDGSDYSLGACLGLPTWPRIEFGRANGDHKSP